MVENMAMFCALRLGQCDESNLERNYLEEMFTIINFCRAHVVFSRQGSSELGGFQKCSHLKSINFVYIGDKGGLNCS